MSGLFWQTEESVGDIGPGTSGTVAHVAQWTATLLSFGKHHNDQFVRLDCKPEGKISSHQFSVLILTLILQTPHQTRTQVHELVLTAWVWRQREFPSCRTKKPCVNILFINTLEHLFYNSIILYLCKSSSFASIKLMLCFTDLAIRIWVSNVSWKRQNSKIIFIDTINKKKVN